MWIEFDKHLWKIVYRGIIKANPSMELIKWDQVRLVLRKTSDSKHTIIIVRPIDGKIYHQGTHFDSIKTPIKTVLPKDYIVSDWVNETMPKQALNAFAESLGGALRTVTNRVVVEFNTDGVELDADMLSTIGFEIRRLRDDEKYEVVTLTDFAGILSRKQPLTNLYLHAYAGEDHPVLYGDAYIPLK